MRNETDNSVVSQRGAALFATHQNEIHRRTDRMFAYLMMAQWVAGIIAAVWVSPKTWAGTQSQVHWHVWAAILIGGAITSLPVALAFLQPGRPLTRHVIGVGQMLTSALLIHLTGGRIETHFHVFGSLAFLAFYRDWRVLISATVVVAGDHFLRGMFWPQSVFGVLASSPWRWIEHAGWVVFEDFFLLLSVSHSLREMRQIAERQARLEAVNREIEERVEQRTAELQQEIGERKRSEAERERIHKQLLDVSRQAGMAEVATSVLHNVGNVLNSVNVSSSLVAKVVRSPSRTHLAKSAELLVAHSNDLPDFLANDSRGKQLPSFLLKLAGQLAGEQKEVNQELASLQSNVDHIKEIVAMQQDYARISGVQETVPATDLVEDAVRMNVLAMERHSVQVVREYSDAPPILVEKHKVLQILVNLIRNAKHALDDCPDENKRVTLRVGLNGNNCVKISIIDNGVGIPSENLSRIFEHGFTTRKDGHGFGLHSAALSARELGGSLTAHSDGPGQGAKFTLELPVQPKALSV
jgi:signal transduction histidine kinase